MTGIFLGDTAPSKIFVGGTEVSKVFVGDTKVRPTIDTRTFTISWTEKSNMSSGWTYSDDAAGLTAGSGNFDDFFGYSAVLLDTNGTETAEMTQSGGVFTGAMTTLGNITSGDNVMIKFPKRGIKMTKSGSVVTLSITADPDKASEGYQYYAFQTGDIDNITDTKDQFYLGAYKGSQTNNIIKSWSGKGPVLNLRESYCCTRAKANNTNLGWNISGFYQRMYINALYMMKYGNPDARTVIGLGNTGGSGVMNTGGTDSQTSASYGTNSVAQSKLFGLEDRWGNIYEWVGGAYVNGSKVLYTQLSGYTGTTSGGASTTTTIQSTTGYNLSAIAGNNKAMFSPIATVDNASYNTYYSAYDIVNTGSKNQARTAYAGGRYYVSTDNALSIRFETAADSYGNAYGCRLMYL